MADSLSRRRFLALVPVASAGGCLGSTAEQGQESPEISALTGITVQNSTFERREIAVTVEKDGEVVYDETQSVDGIEVEEQDTEGNVTVSTGMGGGGFISLEGDWLGDHVEYAITVDSPSYDPLEYTTKEFDDGCAEFLFNATVAPGEEIMTMERCAPGR